MATHTDSCDDTDAQGYEGSDSDGAFNNDDGEFTAGDYADISIDDNNYVIDSTGVNREYQYHRFDFTIGEAVGDITKIDVTWKGRGYRNVPLIPAYGHSLWVKDTGSWAEKDSGTSGSKETLTIQKTNNFDDWISDGHIHVGAQPDYTTVEGHISTLLSYYVEVVVTYEISHSLHVGGIHK